MSDSDSANQTRPRVSADETARVRNPYVFLGAAQRPDEIGRFGDFRVLRLLGSGGMGLVFAAEEVTLGRPIALKVLKPELAADPESRERFLREARAAAGVTSDYVVTVLHVGEENGLPFLAMPLLVGETLQARIEQPVPLDLRTALVVARDTAAGLAAAHAKGLIHRDIKPANIWLEAVDAVECNLQTGTCGDSSEMLGRPPKCHVRAKLLDFGLARKPLTETSLTSTGFIVGTPNFMSPEQAAGHDVDARADLFALGCVIYVVLTGELPFRGSNALAVMMALANRHPDPVSLKNPVVPQEISDLVGRLLAKRPEERCQTATEVVCDLEAAIACLSGAGPVPVRAPEPVPAAASAAARVPGASDGRATAAPGRVRAVLMGAGLVLALGVALVFGWLAFRALAPAGPVGPPEPIAVGVLHSQSGTMAVSENPVIDATLLAIEEVNARGGVNGRPLKAVVVDGKSDPDEFARQAEVLLRDEKCSVVFGCWTSASRKAVRPVFERRSGLLFYPVQYEGLEESPRIVYLGPAPNQQLIPAVDFVIDTLNKKRIALVGSDYIFPRTAHQIIRDRVAERNAAGVEIVAEAFVPLGSPVVQGAIAKVRSARADVVINTINGTSNAAFFRELRAPQTGAPGVTTVSVSITENEVRGLNPAALTDDYLVASYFQTVDRPESAAFVRKIRAKYGADRAATDMMAAAYSGVHLWARAATAANSSDPAEVLAKVRGLEFDGPRARVRIDPENLHTWLPVRVGKVRPGGEVALVPGAGSDAPVRPLPFPRTRTRTRDEWNGFLRQLEMNWNGKWQAPTKQ
ncbi:MAG TPA: transporter substrate-binding protein [Gemmata sp.]